MISKFRPYHEAKGICVSYNVTVERTGRTNKRQILYAGTILFLSNCSWCAPYLFIRKIYLSFLISKRSSLLTARCIIYFRYKSICELMGKVHEEVGSFTVSGQRVVNYSIKIVSILRPFDYVFASPTENVTRKEVILGISSLFRLSSWNKWNKVGERAKITHDNLLTSR